MIDIPPRLRRYSRETVTAAKSHAIVVLGRASICRKDGCDSGTPSPPIDFGRLRLAGAISATVTRRRTAIPHDSPDALSATFAGDGP